MKSLLEGLRHFQRDVLPQKRDLFSHLAKGQQPSTMFVGCSDSRVDPNLLTSTEPGELFVLRNAGNVVPRTVRAPAAKPRRWSTPSSTTREAGTGSPCSRTTEDRP